MLNNEKLIQSGFELIVKAFNEQEKEFCEKEQKLENKVNELEKENSRLRKDNKMLLLENRKLQTIINNLNYNLDTTKKKLDIVRISVGEDNKNNNHNHKIFNKNNNVNKTFTTNGYGKTNTVSSINGNNQNISEYYLNTASATTEFNFDINNYNDSNSEDNVANNNAQIDYENIHNGNDSETEKLSCINYQHTPSHNNINSNYNYNTNSLKKIKSNHFRTRSLNYPSSSRLQHKPSIIKETLTSNANELNDFLLKCKESITVSIFEKILLLFNNHKTGLISTHDLIKRIREFLINNKYLTNIFNQLIIIN
jgi:hypothetical protein